MQLHAAAALHIAQPLVCCATASLLQHGDHVRCAGSLAVSKDDRVASSLAQQGMAPALQQMLHADSTVRTPVLQHMTQKLEFVTHMVGRPELIDQSNDCRARRKACGRVCGGAPCAASTPARLPARSWQQHCSRLAWPPHSRCHPLLATALTAAAFRHNPIVVLCSTWQTACCVAGRHCRQRGNSSLRSCSSWHRWQLSA